MRRPFHVLACLGAVAHHGFELGAGVGLVFQPWLGLGRATALWGALFAAWLSAAARGSPTWDRPLAFAGGMSVGAAAIHYVLWPWELRKGLPYLLEAEGLPRHQLPAYNAILYTWAAAATVALARETPAGRRRWAVAGAMAVIPFRRTVRHHFAWLAERARSEPAWWNRALAPGT